MCTFLHCILSDIAFSNSLYIQASSNRDLVYKGHLRGLQRSPQQFIVTFILLQLRVSLFSCKKKFVLVFWRKREAL